MHKGGYAGTMTGVTAGRLAQRSTQEAGRAISKSLAKVVLNENNVITNREVIRQSAERNMRNSWEKVRHSPIHGLAPTPPVLEAKPSSAGMWMEIAIAGAGAYMGGASALKASKTSQDVAKMLSNQEAQRALTSTSSGGLNLNLMSKYSSSPDVTASPFLP